MSAKRSQKYRYPGVQQTGFLPACPLPLNNEGLFQANALLQLQSFLSSILCSRRGSNRRSRSPQILLRPAPERFVREARERCFPAQFPARPVLPLTETRGIVRPNGLSVPGTFSLPLPLPEIPDSHPEPLPDRNQDRVALASRARA